MQSVLVHQISHELEVNATLLFDGGGDDDDGAVRYESCAKTDDVITNTFALAACLNIKPNVPVCVERKKPTTGIAGA